MRNPSATPLSTMDSDPWQTRNATRRRPQTLIPQRRKPENQQFIQQTWSDIAGFNGDIMEYSWDIDGISMLKSHKTTLPSVDLMKMNMINRCPKKVRTCLDDIDKNRHFNGLAHYPINGCI